MYPVEVAYLQEPAPDYVNKAAEIVWNINLKVMTYSYHEYPIKPPLTFSQQGPGDILVFLTGREEIDRCLQELSDMLPLYAFILFDTCGN